MMEVYIVEESSYEDISGIDMPGPLLSRSVIGVYRTPEAAIEAVKEWANGLDDKVVSRDGVSGLVCCFTGTDGYENTSRYVYPMKVL